MKRSWREKLSERGLKSIELWAELHRIKPPATMNMSEWERWIEQQKDAFSSYPDLEDQRRVKLDPGFVRLYHRASQTGLEEHQLRFLFENVGVPSFLADQLELAQTFYLALESDQNKRIEAYVAVASGIVLLRRMFSGGLKKQLGTKIPNRAQFFGAIAQNLEFIAARMRGEDKEPPGRVNVELADLADAILGQQKEPLTQVELYEAMKAAGATLPEDPEAFRLWLHRARKQGLVKKFRSTRTKAQGSPRKRIPNGPGIRP
jgi:hypothetical protein